MDYSSAFNTVIPCKLTKKLHQLGLSPLLCNWIQDFLTDCSQAVRLSPYTSSSITLSTGTPQGCVLSAILYSLFSQDCVPTFDTNTIVKFADDTTVVGLYNNDESAYRAEVQKLADWCLENNLLLNIGKTKELIIDFRRSQDGDYAPVFINGERVERVPSIRFLGVHITEDLTWTTNTITKGTKRHSSIFFLLEDIKKGWSATRIAHNLLPLLHREHHYILHLYMVS